MNGTMILFHFPEKTDHGTINKFMQKFYGQDSKSWSGKYEFHRKGILEEIPFRKFIRGVIIIQHLDLEKIISYLAEYGAEYYVGTVTQAPESDADIRVP